MLRKINKKIVNLLDWVQYRANQFLYHQHLPDLDVAEYQILYAIRKDGVASVPLQKLGLLANEPFLRAAQQLIQNLLCIDAKHYENEYGQGFQHCIPINPTTIARKYLEIKLWGLDEKLLDIIRIM